MPLMNLKVDKEEQLTRIWSLKVFNISRSIVNEHEPVLSYLKDGLKRGFVIEELMIVSEGTELPPL